MSGFLLLSAVVTATLAGQAVPRPAGPVDGATPTAPAAPAPALDPARLAAASELIDLLMPPATREQMIAGMLAPMLANIRRGFSENPQFMASIDRDPKVRGAFDAYLGRQQQRTTDLLRQSLPGMTTAMARAYARRFDLQQLHDIRAFFETPTGHAYMQAAYTIMSDPDIATWQRQIMGQAIAHLQEDAAAFARQLEAQQGK